MTDKYHSFGKDHTLGKGGAVSSILTGGTTTSHKNQDLSDSDESAYSAVPGRTQRESAPKGAEDLRKDVVEPFTERELKMFWDRAPIGEPNLCWEWAGTQIPRGYGFITRYVRAAGGWDRSTLYAHRMSYQLHKGVIPNGLFVLHRCDNPSCVNPRHLWLGTHQDNVDDMMAKGRHKPGRGKRRKYRKTPTVAPYGEI